MTSSRTDQRIDNPVCIDASGGSVLLSISNVGVAAATVLVQITKHASQSGDSLQIIASDGTTKHWFIDANHNTVTYGAQTAPGTTDTNGFLGIPAVAGAQTGVPANVTGAYANCAWMRYDKTNHKIYVYDGAWKSTAALA
jgi:predicted small secreted protein